MSHGTLGIVLGLLFGFLMGWRMGRSWLMSKVREDLDDATNRLRELYGQEIKLADGTSALIMTPEVEALLSKVKTE